MNCKFQIETRTFGFSHGTFPIPCNKKAIYRFRCRTPREKEKEREKHRLHWLLVGPDSLIGLEFRHWIFHHFTANMLFSVNFVCFIQIYFNQIENVNSLKALTLNIDTLPASIMQIFSNASYEWTELIANALFFFQLFKFQLCCVSCFFSSWFTQLTVQYSRKFPIVFATREQLCSLK